MTTSLKYIQQYDSVMKRLQGLGMRLDQRTQRGAWSAPNSVTVYAVYPSEKALPHYERDAELFIGTLDDIDTWLAGVQWMQAYYATIGIDDGSHRAKAEDAERNRQMMYALQNGELPRLRR